MSYEWHTTFDLTGLWERIERLARRARGSRPVRDQDRQAELARYIGAAQGPLSLMTSPQAVLALLAQSLGDEGGASSWHTVAKGAYATLLDDHYCDDVLAEDLATWAPLGFETPRLTRADLDLLPAYSFFLYLPFTLSSPYVSKDDAPFYVHENPVRKDPVLRTPMVAPTGWKGAFRAALRYRYQSEAGPDHRPEGTDAQFVRLVGNAQGAQERFCRGRLRFYPAFFSRMGVGVINPHNRRTSAGEQPIYIEMAPRGSEGVFALLYVPLYLADVTSPAPLAPREAWALVMRDVVAVLETTRLLLRDLGLGAKTGSGMGRAGAELPAPGYLLLPTGRTRGPLARRVLRQPIEPHLDYLGLIADQIAAMLEGGHDG